MAIRVPPQQLIDMETGGRLWNTAQSKYPLLKKSGLQFFYRPKADFQDGRDNHSETYPKDETWREDGIPQGVNATVVYNPKATPEDVLAEYVSHIGRNEDPRLKAHYAQFVKSLTQNQERILQGQYHEAKSRGEQRPYDIWRETSGVPAYYRGYLFNQWKVDPNKYYPPEQQKQLDSIRPYLEGKQ